MTKLARRARLLAVALAASHPATAETVHVSEEADSRLDTFAGLENRRFGQAESAREGARALDNRFAKVGAHYEVWMKGDQCSAPALVR